MVVVDFDDAETPIPMYKTLLKPQKMDWETDEIDLPQNSDCSKLGDQNNKMDEEEESEVLMIMVSDQEEHHKS
ncbi:hypothetical protein BY996DRAFT_6457967 [Phakopsora pachyrhizi]|nr:hypothetical protein BY996DRAFT_6457967 [Phakopsora pachyrhizi]